MSIAQGLLSTGLLFWAIGFVFGLAAAGSVPTYRRKVYFAIGWVAFGLGVVSLFAAIWTEALL